ncbi:zinc finger protein 384-like isoform X2 [Bolinopsis microptera]|uniref:zinc finger protein 384-like isoform X2 n=1 Tax=Bolinopsis microptera TaxID=2820187 RepID=UPI003079DDE1
MEQCSYAFRYSGERILFECDVTLPDRDIIDVCGGILKEGQEVMKVPGQRNHSIANLIAQLSRLKKELAPCPGLFPSPVSFFTTPLQMPLPHSTSLHDRSTPLPNISLPLTYPRLPVIISTSSLSPASWLQTETRNTKEAAEKYVQDVQDVQDSNSLSNSTKTNIEDNQVGFRSLCPGLRSRYGSLSPINTTASSSTATTVLSDQTPVFLTTPTATTTLKTSSGTAVAPHATAPLGTIVAPLVTAPLGTITTTPQQGATPHINKMIGRTLISSNSVWSPYLKEKDTANIKKSWDVRMTEEYRPRSESPRYNYNLKDEKSFECKYCDYQAKQYNQLARHWKTHSGERPYQCGMCDYSAALKHNLVQHMWSKHTARKKYQCSECDYSATRRDYLAAHRTQHTGYKPFTCPHCSWETGLKSNMTQHMKRKHSAKSDDV